MRAGACSCPLCRCADTCEFFRDNIRSYLSCNKCSLVFVPSAFWLSRAEEKGVYDLHENDPDDQGYRKFLNRLSEPLLQRLGPFVRTGLDFGCGPGPALATMLAAHGHRVVNYDPIYCDDDELLTGSYDFICATEVVEHLRAPEMTFSLLFRMLGVHGWLGIMTKLVNSSEAFATWHYIRDLTHIAFFSRATFEFLAAQYHAELHFVAADVILLRKLAS